MWFGWKFWHGRTNGIWGACLGYTGCIATVLWSLGLGPHDEVAQWVAATAGEFCFLVGVEAAIYDIKRRRSFRAFASSPQYV